MKKFMRRLAVTTLAILTSFLLTALIGYLLYSISAARSEDQLSVVVRFLLNPTIAVLVGFLVGTLSVDRPAVTAIIGLLPWIIAVGGSPHVRAISTTLHWIAPVVVYVLLSAIAAVMGSRVRRFAVESQRT